MPDELAGYLQLERNEDLAREVGYYVLRKMERVGFDGLSRPEQRIGCLTELEMEIKNGGFDQYYWIHQVIMRSRPWPGSKSSARHIRQPS